MRIARSKSLPMPWTRVGVRLIPKGHSANRSLSAIEPVSATAKRKLENGEQETGARNLPRKGRNTENYRPETGIRQRNPRECRGFSHTGKYHPGDPTAWLGREDSNLRVAESKSAALPLGSAPTPLFSRAAARGGRTIMRGGTSRNRAVGGQKSALGFLDNARTVGRGQPSRQFSVARQKSCPLAPEIGPIGRNRRTWYNR